MAEINIERKKSPWPWIIGLIILLVLIWGLFKLFNNNDVVDTTAPVPVATAPLPMDQADSPPPADRMVTVAPMPPPPTAADNTPIPIPVIIVGPGDFLGQPVVGTAQVAEVPSNRGFWLEQDGQRMFAVIAQSPNMEDAININPGQQVRLAGVAYDSALASQIAGGLDPETMQIIADQPAFLLVAANNIAVIDR